MLLYHYTCAHGLEGIGTEGTGVLMPHQGLVWLTDLEAPFREALGLTSYTLSCDRTAHRFRAVDGLHAVMPWVQFRREAVPPDRRAWAAALEAAPGAMPRHWWVCALPLLAVFDPV